MAVGKKVISAFSGPADVNSFDMINHVPSSHTIKAKKSPEREELEGLYKSVRAIREEKESSLTLSSIFQTLKSNHPTDWLLSIEIIEILKDKKELELTEQVLMHLEKVKQNRSEVAHLITGGLELLFEKTTVEN
jgi:phenylalanine-4-hydroxylase